MTTPSQPDEGRGPSRADRLAEHLSEIMPRLLALASHWLHGHIADSEDAADVVQDVLLKALQDGSFRRISEADLEAWLAVCIRRHAANLQRCDSHFQEVREDVARSVTPSPDDPASFAEVQDAVRAALDALPEPDREVLRLRFLEAMDWGAIGRQLGVTPDAARVRASRVLLRLRDLLSGEGTGEHAPD